MIISVTSRMSRQTELEEVCLISKIAQLWSNVKYFYSHVLNMNVFLVIALSLRESMSLHDLLHYRVKYFPVFVTLSCFKYTLISNIIVDVEAPHLDPRSDM